MALIPLATRVTWLGPGGPLPTGAIVLIWANSEGAGAAQEFIVLLEGAIAGLLDISGDGVDPQGGSRKCLIRAYVKEKRIAAAVPKETQIAAAVPVIQWRQNRITGPLALGFLIKGRVTISSLGIDVTPVTSIMKQNRGRCNGDTEQQALANVPRFEDILHGVSLTFFTTREIGSDSTIRVQTIRLSATNVGRRVRKPWNPVAISRPPIGARSWPICRLTLFGPCPQ